MSLRGNPYGLAVCIADTREEAAAKIWAAIAEAGPSAHPPTQQYVKELLDALDDSIEEIPEGVFVDWTPPTKVPRPSISVN
jgi:hypothetical protein